jgi:TetR/AcrR family transcriptional regulator of autoinduction and epiphytic fitness
VNDTEARIDPRITESRRRVLTATLEELNEVGYGAFAIESVSRRSGVAKSTIYRHWPGKLAMLADALRSLNVQPGSAEIGDPATLQGSPRVQVVTLVRHLATGFASGSAVAASTPALVDAAERDADLRDLFHDYTARRRQALIDALAAGVASGVFPASVDPELAAAALAGAVMYRRLMTPTPLDPADADALVTTVLGPQ